MGLWQSILGSAGGAAVVTGVALVGANGATPTRIEVAIAHAVAVVPAVDARDLAGIANTESAMGTLQGAHVDEVTGRAVRADGSSITSPAGALGPFQFMPATWAVYATDGDGDGYADIDDVDDAAVSAARLLIANGYTADRENAIGQYNGGANWRSYAESRNYVASVSSHAASAAVPLSSKTAPTVKAKPTLLGLGLGIYRQAEEGFAVALGAKDDYCANGKDAAYASKGCGALNKYLVETAAPVTVGGPTAKPSMPATAAKSPPGTCLVDGGAITSTWGDPRSGGRTHRGNDVSGSPGAAIRTPADGIVVAVQLDEPAGGLGGRSMNVAYEGGDQLYFAHIETSNMVIGQPVKAGQQIAVVGDTGNARGSGLHLHVQYHPGGGAPSEQIDQLVGALCPN